jgi:hypothetical protein
VFADWLEETGDTARAELIRIQCELQLSNGSDRAQELSARAQELEHKHAEEWYGALREHVDHCRFDCGTLHVTLSGSRYYLLRSLGSAFGFSTLGRILATPEARQVWSWVTGISLIEADDRLLDDVVRSPQFGTIVSLAADSVEAGGTAVLAESLHVTRLRWLLLNGSGIGSDGATSLAVSPRLAGLRELHLRMCGIGDGGAKAIAYSPFLENLTRLNLNHNDIGAEGAQALADTPHLPRLQTLHLHGNPLGPAVEALQKRYGAGLRLGA